MTEPTKTFAQLQEQFAKRLGSENPQQMLENLDVVLGALPPLHVLIRYDRNNGDTRVMSLDPASSPREVAMALNKANEALLKGEEAEEKKRQEEAQKRAAAAAARQTKRGKK